MSLMPHALTTLEAARSHLNIPASDTTQTPRLELFINAATARLESMTDRLLKERTVTEIRSGRRNNIVLCRQWPVSSVTSLYIDADGSFGADSLVDASEYQLADDGTSILLKGAVFDSGYNNLKLVYVAGYNATDHPGAMAELEVACLWLVEWFYKHRERGDMGRASKSKGDESVGILTSMPAMIREIVQDYKRTEMPLGDRPIANL